jgi:serine/threonine-protein kinase
MTTALEKRALKLAVSLFGADPEKVRRLYAESLHARSAGQRGDFLEALVAAGVLTAEQTGRLRHELDRTTFDAQAIVRPSSGVGIAKEAARQPVETEKLERIGDYRLVRPLGEGAMGSVHLAVHEPTGTEYAIKILAPHLELNKGLVERFEREAEHIARLNHPHIVRGHGVGKDPTSGRHFLIMEYVDGPSAQALLDEHAKLVLADAVRITLDIARALEHAHSRNIVHRDIKPENVLITRSGLAKLADLGLSRQTDVTSNLTAHRQGFGTPYYMPYEQALNAKDADARSDVYALGATFYHLLTGQPPFLGETQVEVLEKKASGAYPPAYLLEPEIPEELSRILDRMLAASPQDRYQTASELIVELERTGLAAPLLSFSDRDLAMKDPVVRARAASSDLATKMDVNGPAASPPTQWYVRHVNREGKHVTAKATTARVIEAIRTHLLTSSAEASPNAKGPFRKLGMYGAFREALHQAAMAEAEQEAPEEEPPRGRWIGWLLLAGALIALASGVAAALWHFLSE